MPGYYGLLFRSTALPWDVPILQGPVTLEKTRGGIAVRTETETLGLISQDFSQDTGDGRRLGLFSGAEVLLFADETQALSWQIRGRREKGRWDHLLDDLLDDCS